MTQSAAASTSAAPAFDIHVVDCIRFLEGLPDESVDIIVTDPAYSGMNQHMRFGHGRIVGHYGRPGNARWFTEFSDDPDTYRRFLNECRRVLRDDRHRPERRCYVIALRSSSYGPSPAQAAPARPLPTIGRGNVFAARRPIE